jgi:hypothetical protein
VRFHQIDGRAAQSDAIRITFGHPELPAAKTLFRHAEIPEMVTLSGKPFSGTARPPGRHFATRSGRFFVPIHFNTADVRAPRPKKRVPLTVRASTPGRETSAISGHIDPTL